MSTSSFVGFISSVVIMTSSTLFVAAVGRQYQLSTLFKSHRLFQENFDALDEGLWEAWEEASVQHFSHAPSSELQRATLCRPRFLYYFIWKLHVGDCMLAIPISRMPADSTCVQILVFLWPAKRHPLTRLGSCKLWRSPTTFFAYTAEIYCLLSDYRILQGLLYSRIYQKCQPRGFTAAIVIPSKLSRDCVTVLTRNVTARQPILDGAKANT